MEQKRYGESFILRMKHAYHEVNILPLIQASCRGKVSPRILEFGPGLGVLAELLLKEYPEAEYHAIDVDGSVLTRLKNEHSQVSTYCLQSIDEYEKEEFEAFDVIVGLDVWEHLPSRQLEGYTRRSIQLLAKGGVFVAQVPNWGCPFTPHSIFAGDLTHANRFNELSAVQLLLNSGVEIENVEILPYRFPKGVVGLLRALVRRVILFLYKCLFFILGVQRLRIMTPNLIMVACGHKESGVRCIDERELSE